MMGFIKKEKGLFVWEWTNHCIEIGETINQSRGFCETLLKSIAEIVSRVGWDDENRRANRSEKDREDRTACGFTNTTFATNENPLERILF